MTTEKFKKEWEKVKGQPVDIEYGKQVYRNVTLKHYNEAEGTVKTALSGYLNTRSIKKIVLREPKQEAITPEEVPNQLEKVTKEQLAKGYFACVGKYAGNWKHGELLDGAGEVVSKSDSTFAHKVVFDWATELKLKDKNNQLPEVLLDKTDVLGEVFTWTGSGWKGEREHGFQM